LTYASHRAIPCFTSCAVGHGRYAHGLQQDLCSAPTNDPKEYVVGLRALKRDFKAKAIAIESQCHRNITHDKER
jgi:hypothetical protein